MRIPVLLSLLTAAVAGAGESTIELRAENLVVNPSTGPVCYVAVVNRGTAAWRGTLSVTFPDRWKVDATEKDVSVPAGGRERVPFSIEKAVDVAANRYPMEMTAAGGGRTVTRTQDVICASAPYLKATVDGDTDEWKDAIPVAFETAGRKTVVRTYWTRRYFYILVAVEEEAFSPPTAGKPGDCVQLAFATRDAKPARKGGTSSRWEYLACAGESGAGRCLVLLSPGDPVSEGQKPRPLSSLDEAPRSTVAVARRGGRTVYEISVSLRAMRALRPAPGREFCFSCLVRDPDGTGLRDLGAAAGLPASRRNRYDWSVPAGCDPPEQPPFDGKIEWGFCSSIH